MDFDQCFSQGKRFFSRVYVVFFLQKMNQPKRLAVVVTKKTGGAVVRNSWKRLVRENFRLEKSRLSKNGDYVVIVKKTIQGKPDPIAKKELLELFVKVGKI